MYQFTGEISILISLIISGLTMGFIYIIIAEGLNLIWGVMGIVNLAHGEFIMLGMYITYFVSIYLNINPLLSIFISFIALFIFGIILNESLIKRVIGATPLMSMLLTFGISIFLINMGVIFFGGDSKIVDFVSGSIIFKQIVISKPRTITAAISIVISLLMYWFLQRTETGMAIRAVSIDKDTAMHCGINIRKINAITFGIGAALAGVAGSLISFIYSFTPMVGQTFMLKAFAIVVLGGMGHFIGIIIAGLILGVFEALGAYYINVHLSEAIAFILIILTLLIRPTGIMGIGND
ncbi:MAG: branched-chain amino acid ABC transporter permease [Candidatus Humimicrobiia bacterium]